MAHVVQQYPVDARRQGRPDVVERLGLDLQAQPRLGLVQPGDGRRDPAGQAQVVVLDEQRLAQVEAVVGSAAATDGVLLEIAQPGRGLARVQEHGAGAVQFGHAAGRQSGDPGQPAEQVQGSPLAGQDGAARTA